MGYGKVDELAINTIRTLAVREHSAESRRVDWRKKIASRKRLHDNG